MSLFKTGPFILASGALSEWKIDCDALDDEDWETLALMFTLILPPFGEVEGVPTGGLKLADALRQYADPDSDRLLICDDVWTTGGSWDAHRADREAMGAVVFARNAPTTDHDVFVIFPMLLFTPTK